MMRRVGGLKYIAPRAGAGINQPRVSQFLPPREIECAALALEVGPKGAVSVRALIPAQSEPMKVFNDRVAKFDGASIGIQIFDSENELSTSLRTILGAPEGDGMTKMKIACRRRGDSAAIRNFGFQMADFRLTRFTLQSVT